MDWRRFVRRRLPPIEAAPEREIEIVDELAAQLQAVFERAIGNGATADEAMAMVEAEVPDWSALARTLGRIERPYLQPPAAGAGTGGLMTGLVQDVRYALRTLKRAPLFAAMAILTLALGIAATTVVYSLVDGILLRPLPIEHADRIVLARELVNGNEDGVSWPNFKDWRERATSFEQLAAWRGLTTNLRGIGTPRRLQARQVTWNLLDTLGVKPVLGRDFTADDDQPGVPRVAIVSHGFWQRDLGGDAAAIGRTITLDDVPVTVIGVLPASFTVARQEDVFFPFGNFVVPAMPMYLGRGNHFGLAGIGRLKPTATLTSANAEMVSIARQLEQEHPASNSGNSAIVRPLFDVLVGSARPMLLVLLGAVVAMLLTACVNLANLLLARAARRSQEMAVRRSLGAARWRIARQMLIESLLLSLAGGAAGIVLALGGFQSFMALVPPDQPRLHTVTIDLRVLAFSALVSIATGLLFGLVPAIQAATGRAMPLLRSSRVTGATGAGARTRRALLFAEVALALILVAGAGLMLRTMDNLMAVDTGFRSDQVVSAQFNLSQRYDEPRRLAFLDSALAEIRAVPGVSNAAFTFSLPVAGSNWNSIFIIEGRPVPARSELPVAAWTPVTDGYFDTMGIRLERGRTFQSLDLGTSPTVMVVNRTFARTFFGDGDPIGARVKQGWPEDKQPWREIVGVVDDVKVASLDAAPTMQAYLPVTQVTQRSGAFVVRADGDPRGLGRAVEAAVHEVDPDLPLFNIRTMAEVINEGVGQQRMTMVLLMGFAGLALLMAALGVFGVTAYSVSQRTHEIGVRMAIGASSSRVLGLVLRQEMLACVLGIGAGVLGAMLLSSLLQSLLFGVAPRDAATLAAAAAVLFVVTVVACYLPARRATQINPMSAVRSE